MTTKICIIEVNLGIDVNAITADEITTLSEQTRAELDRAIQQAKAVQRVRQQRIQRRREMNDKLVLTMGQAYERLVAAGETGLPVSVVMKMVADHVSSVSAFSLRMKSLLRSKGNPYILRRKKVHGVPYYVLKPYNLESSNAPA